MGGGQKYIDLHAQLHELRDYPFSHESCKAARGMYFPGVSIRYHVNEITRLVRGTGSKTLLDYGVGQGLQYSEMKVQDNWGGIVPVHYDPAVLEFSIKPEGFFDGVICTDVMEHVHESVISETLMEIFNYADKFIIFSIALDASTTLLPNGEGVHVTVKPVDWWLYLLEKHKKDGVKTEVYFGTAKGFESHVL